MSVQFNLPSVDLTVDTSDLSAQVLTQDYQAVTGVAEIACEMKATAFNRLGYIFRVKNDLSGTTLANARDADDIDVEFGRCAVMVGTDDASGNPTWDDTNTLVDSKTWAGSLNVPSSSTEKNLNASTFGQAVFTSDSEYNQNRFGRDLTCHLAQHIFGTFHGVDLFTNEVTLSADGSGDVEGSFEKQINTEFSDAFSSENAKDFICSNTVASTNLSEPGNYSDGVTAKSTINFYQLGASSADNSGTVAGSILQIAFAKKHSMVNDLSGTNGWETRGDYKVARMDLNAGDILAFTITFSFAAQTAVGSVTPATRTYKVLITLKD
jgi:hypothetical protein